MENHPRQIGELGVGSDAPLAAPPREFPIVRAALLFYGALFAAALLWSLLSGYSLLFASPEAALRGVAPLRDVAWGALAAAVTIGVSDQVTRRTGWGEELGRGLARLLGRRSLRDCIVLALASGVAEEAVFRGALQPRIGLVGASLLFGLAHLAPRRELLPWTGFAVAAGFLLGGLYAVTGNLVAPIVAHVGINAVNLRLLSLRYAP